jgi:hypothetical protein
MSYRSKKTRYVLYSLLVALIIFIGFRVYYRVTDDFRVSNINFPMPHHPEWEIHSLTEDEKAHLSAIFHQPFHYIGKGAQSYAFASGDDQYVIKFFKFKHLTPSLLVKLLPSIPPFENYKNFQIARKKRKLDDVFEGYRLAYHEDRDESGLLYIHLNPTPHLWNQDLVVHDKIGRKHAINLDQTVFVVQNKGRVLREILSEQLKEGNTSFAKQRIGQIFDLYLGEYSKGIFDHDHGVMRNVGFVGDKPIHLDIGKLKTNPSMKDPAVAKADLILVAKSLDTWIKANFPQYREQLMLEMEERISAVDGQPFHF